MPNSTVPAAATGLPTRRLFLASGSAGAVFGAVSAAAAIAAPPAGPVSTELLKLIEAHAATERAYDCSSEQEWETEKVFKGLVKDIDFSRVCVDDWTFNWNDPAGSRAALVKCLDNDRLCLTWNTRHTGDATLTRLQKLWDEVAAEKIALFDSLAAEVEAARMKAGYSDAFQRTFDLNTESGAIVKQICAFPCSTLEEVRVKAKFLYEFLPIPVPYDFIAPLFDSLGGAPAAEG